MSFAGSTVYASGPRLTPPLSASLSSQDAGSQPMRRGVARLGVGLVEGVTQLSLAQQSHGWCLWPLNPLITPGRFRLPADGLLARAYGGPRSQGAHNLPQRQGTSFAIDKNHVNNLRAKREAERLNKDACREYDDCDAPINQALYERIRPAGNGNRTTAALPAPPSSAASYAPGYPPPSSAASYAPGYPPPSSAASYSLEPYSEQSQAYHHGHPSHHDHDGDPHANHNPQLQGWPPSQSHPQFQSQPQSQSQSHPQFQPQADPAAAAAAASHDGAGASLHEAAQTMMFEAVSPSDGGGGGGGGASADVFLLRSRFRPAGRALKEYQEARAAREYGGGGGGGMPLLSAPAPMVHGLEVKSSAARTPPPQNAAGVFDGNDSPLAAMYGGDGDVATPGAPYGDGMGPRPAGAGSAAAVEPQPAAAAAAAAGLCNNWVTTAAANSHLAADGQLDAESSYHQEDHGQLTVAVPDELMSLAVTEGVAEGPYATAAAAAVEIAAGGADEPAPKKKRKSRSKKAEDAAAVSAAAAESLLNAPAAALTPARKTRRKKAAIAEAPAEAEAAGAFDATPLAAAGAADGSSVPARPTRGAAVKGRAAAAAAAPAALSYLADGVKPKWPPEPYKGGGDLYYATEDYLTKQPLLKETPADILVVDTPEVARAVVDKLLLEAHRPYPKLRPQINPPVPCRYFGCDTEVAFIDVSTETPVGHGAVLCFSIYGGDDLDFADCAVRAAATHGSGPAPGWEAAATHGSAVAARKDRIWVDVWSEVELDVEGRPIMEGRYVKLKPHHPIIDEFKRFFEDDDVKKVWHNYGFDRHVLENMGILCRGFGGDTLHMARLADASRSGKRTYGLDSLTADPKIMKNFIPYRGEAPPRERMGNRRGRPAAAAAAPGGPGDGTTVGTADGADGGSGTSPGSVRSAQLATLVKPKISMKERFGLYRLRDGGPAKVPVMPQMQELHQLDLFRPTWIEYSALDAKATWQLREALEGALRIEPWTMETSLAKQLGYLPDGHSSRFLHLWHFYCSYWLEFGELLTEMERRGMMVNRAHLAQAQVKAEADRKAAVEEFRDWAESRVPGARHMNVGSGTQIRMLLFPDHAGHATKAAAQEASKAKAAAARAATKSGAPPPSGEAAGRLGAAPAASAVGEGGVDAAPAEAHSRIIKVLNPQYEDELARGLKSSRYLNIELYGIWGKGVPGRLEPEVLTATNAAAVSIKVLRGLAGKPGAARKELTKLLEARAAAGAAAATEAAAAAAAAQRTAVPIVGDVLDSTLEELQEGDNNDNGHGEGDEDDANQEVEGSPDAGKAAGGQESAEDPSATAAHRPAAAAAAAEGSSVKAALEQEAKDKGLGKLFAACGGGEEGLKACIAVEALCEVSAIDKLLSAFIIPLQSDATSTTSLYDVPVDATGAEAGDQAPSSSTPKPAVQQRAVHRVHCSLNINTETGRLSARRPNLQNQPALEKDRYKVRQAFGADTAAGHTLVVADYGQLELRILAHMTNCKSMQEAFIAGGDFHSRTAYGMYDEIKKDVESGGCYLEWEGTGEPDKPLVKDKYAAERRKAKVLNFSIAYGKTAHGLAADFKTTREEAQATVDRWYSDRPEVRQWQADTIAAAKQEFKVRTLLGRTRPLPNINSNEFKLAGHSQRAAINTPIQGSAADVAAAAMVAIHKSEELRRTGFKLLMQIHDEVILEGPREHSEAAKRLVMSLMANPWAELAKHWNDSSSSSFSSAAGTSTSTALMKGDDWYRGPPEVPGGHLAGVWRHGRGAGAAEGAGAEGGAGGGSGGARPAMPLLVELATDCNVADTWYEAK